MHQRFSGFPETGLSGQAKTFAPRLFQGFELAINRDLSFGQYIRIGDWVCGQAFVINAGTNGTNANLLFASLPVTPGRVHATGFGSTIHGLHVGGFVVHRVSGAVQYEGSLVAPTDADTTPAIIAAGDSWAKFIKGDGIDLGVNTSFSYENGSVMSYSFGYFATPVTKYT